MDFFEWRVQRGEQADEDAERLAAILVDAAVEVHRHLGPFQPERSYEYALSHELCLRGIPHVCQQRVDIVYKDKLVGGGRTDILVGNKLVVELKAVAALAEEHVAQVLINLRLRHLRLGLRLNFNGITMKGQFRRVVLDPQYL